MSTSNLKRLLSLVLVLVMVISMVPFPTYATEEDQSGNSQETTVSETSPTESEEPSASEETPADEESSASEETPAQQSVEIIDGHPVHIIPALKPTCTATGLTEGKRCADCGVLLVPQEIIPATGHTEVETEEEPALCEETGLKAGTYCSVCKETLSGREVIPARGHNIFSFDAKLPTFNSVGWNAYEKCMRCGYTTYEEIPALEVPTIEDYETFLMYLSLLEQLANLYVLENPGKDPLELMIKYIRTGVDRYNSGSWGIMAGYEDADFAKYVAEMEDMVNAEATSPEEMIAVCSLKNLGNITLPNGNKTDIGHMFGTMDITYHNNFGTNHADVGGWSGDLVDLLEFSDLMKVSGSLEEMVTKIGEELLLKTPPIPSSPSFSLSDMYGDMDALYLMTTLKKSGYHYDDNQDFSGLTALIMEYFTEDLSMEDRAEFFLKNRLDGASTRNAVRDAVYNAYTTNKVIATLEGTREFTSEDLDTLRKAVCYAFADYMCKLGGDYVAPADTSYFDVFSSNYSVLAPGITQEIKQATTTDGKQIVYYVATADITRDDVEVYANYNENDPTQGWAMQRVLDQANAAQRRHSNPDDPENYIPNYNVVVSTNGAGFNMSTGEPGGLLVMGGVEYHPINSDGFFGILKDGTPVIASTKEYNEIYKGQVRDGIAGFGATLVKDGKIVATGNTSRHSRTAVGITKTGKVVLMVLDGRQEPFSAGGDMGEIAQIMLEAGCWHAINLDGGGSTTYVAKQPGEEELSVINRPSDGFQRSVAASLMMVSTAPSSTAFDHAILESDTDYLTIGTSLQLTAKGISATGNEAQLPEITGWEVSDEDWATITDDGVFTALRNGDVEVYLMSGETVLGTKTMHIVTPNKVYFTKTNLDTVFGATTALPVKVLYDGKPVTVNENDLVFSLSNTGAGKVEGFNFVATSNENTNIKNVVITAALKADTSVAGTITVALYKQGEMTFDFDQATGGDRMLAWYRQVTNATQDDANTYVVVDPDKPMLTNYTLAIDMTQIPIPQKLEDLTYMLPGSDVEGANAWTFLMQLAQRISVLSTITATVKFDSSLDVDISNMKLVNDFFVLTATEIDEETNTVTMTLNWKKQTAAIDPNTANPLCIVSGIKLTPKSDADWGTKSRLDIVNSGSISYKIYMRASALYSFSQKPENQKTFGLYAYANPNDAEDKGGYFQDTYKTFEDNYTLVGALKEGWLLEEGGYAYYVNGKRLTGVQLVDDLYYNFGTDGINPSKTPYTGLFQIDGVNHYAKNGAVVKGWQAIDDEWYLFNWSTGKAIDGTHQETIEGVLVTYQMDNGKLVKGYWHENENGLQYFYGPYMYKQGLREIDGQQYIFEEYYACVGIRPVRLAHAVTATWYEFTDKGVMVGLAPDGLHWYKGELYYVVGANSDHNGFYEIDGNYYYFRSDDTAAVGTTYYANNTNNILPAGTYRFDAEGKAIMTTEVVDENGTLYYYRDGMRINNAGLVKVGDDYYCIGNGGIAYADTYAYVADNNAYGFRYGNYYFGADGKLVKFTGLKEHDGELYYYKDGKQVRNAYLVQVEGEYYYIDSLAKAVKNTSVWISTSKTNGLRPQGTYEFGADGKMIRHNGIINGCYYEDGISTAAGLVKIDGNYYYAASGGKLVTGKSCKITNHNDLLPLGIYRFDAEGKAILTTEVAEEDGELYYYVEGLRQGKVGLVKVGDDYYCIGSGGAAYTNADIYVAAGNSCGFAQGYYRFGADGKLVVFTGLMENNGTLYYYVNGKRTANAGLVKFEGDYYCIGSSGVAFVNTYAYVHENNAYGFRYGYYWFGADGKLVDYTGLMNHDGVLYYYVNGRQTRNAGLVEIEGDFYYIDELAKAVTNTSVYVSRNNGLRPQGTYDFGADGKMIRHNGVVNGYYYVDGIRTAAGLVQQDGNYYYAVSGGRLVTGQSYNVTAHNGLLPAGYYCFDTEGKANLTTHITEENGKFFYYKNGLRQGKVGLVELSGDYYCIGSGGVAYTSADIYVASGNSCGFAQGYYYFGEDGKLVVFTGLIENNGKLYYYVNGKRTANAGLVKLGDDYYCIGAGGAAFVGTYAYVNENNAYGFRYGYYYFGEDGKLVDFTGIMNHDGVLYYYANGRQLRNAGLIEFESAYYYIDNLAKAVTNTSVWVSTSAAHGLMPQGTYDFGADGKLLRHNGVVNGYYYVNGIRTAAGLVEQDGYLYFAGASGKLVVNQSYWISQTNGLVTTGTYRFDAEGKMIKTTEIVNEDGTLYYYRSGRRTANAGLVKQGDDYYCIGNGGLAYVDTFAYVDENNAYGFRYGYYYFGEDGKLVDFTGIMNNDGVLYYYVNGRQLRNAGLIEFEGAYYYIDNLAKAVTNTSVWVSTSAAHGLIPQGTYDFGADGKLIRHNGVVNGYYYVDGVRTAAGLVEQDGSYYYAVSGGKLVVSQSYNVTVNNNLLTAGIYRFDAEGKAVLTTEVVDENGTLYYYKNGRRTANAGLVKQGDDYYCIGNGGAAYVDTYAYVNENNAYGFRYGYYLFGQDGKLVNYTGLVDHDGTLYYYVDGRQLRNAGLIEFEGAYYYIDNLAKAVTDTTVWISASAAHGLVPQGSYTFGADGKMI